MELHETHRVRFGHVIRQRPRDERLPGSRRPVEHDLPAGAEQVDDLLEPRDVGMYSSTERCCGRPERQRAHHYRRIRHDAVVGRQVGFPADQLGQHRKCLGEVDDRALLGEPLRKRRGQIAERYRRGSGPCHGSAKPRIGDAGVLRWPGHDSDMEMIVHRRGNEVVVLHRGQERVVLRRE